MQSNPNMYQIFSCPLVAPEFMGELKQDLQRTHFCGLYNLYTHKTPFMTSWSMCTLHVKGAEK